MKLTIFWNVWNNYLDTALGSEIVRLTNNEQKVFEELQLFSQGGYLEPPSTEHSQYLDEHVFLGYPPELLIADNPKFKGALRILLGLQNAYRFAERAKHDFVLFTNADAWPLSLEKLKAVLERPEINQAAVSARVAMVTGLKMNFGSRVPQFDDHFIILNVGKCRELGVFDYDESARFYKPNFATYGGIHNMLCAFVNQRVPKGYFHIYTHLEDAIGQYGDPCGFNLLPWQYQPSTGFLHANCAQIASLNHLRAQFLHDLGYTRFPLAIKYYEATAPDMSRLRKRRGLWCNKRTMKRWILDHMIWRATHDYLAMRKAWFKIKRNWDPQVNPNNLEYFEQNQHIWPVRLQG